MTFENIVKVRTSIIDITGFSADDFFWDTVEARKERANNVKKRNYFTKYSEMAQAVLNELLNKYSDEGVEALESKDALKTGKVVEFGRPIEIAKKGFGGPKQYEAAIAELEKAIYSTTPDKSA